MGIVFILGFIFFALVFFVPLSRAYADTDLEYVGEWADAHAVELTERSRPMVFWYLRNARVLRTIGVLTGLVVPTLVAWAIGSAARFPQNWTWLLVGYFVGALYAEISLSRPRPSGRTVSLVSRDVSWYLPKRLIVAQQVILVAAPVLALGAALVPFDEDTGLNRPLSVAAALVASICVLAAIVAERWVVRRPQPFTDPDMLAADDAIRAQSVHSLAGSALGAGLLVLSQTFWFLANSEIDVLQVLGFMVLVCPIAALVAVRYYAHRAWRVQRPAAAMAR